MVGESRPARRSLGRFAPSPRQFRDFLIRLGPIAVKMGQYLAVRPDLVAEEYCDVLMDLTDHVPPFPWPIARQVITEDLGERAPDLLACIEPEPIASGSLAQVYLARLPDCGRVAVKVQRPNLRALVDKEVRRLRRLAWFLQVAHWTFVVDPRDAVDELARWIYQEIDFVHELGNLNRLFELACTDPASLIPQPYPRFCGDRVVTAEYLQGIVLSDLLRESRVEVLPEPDKELLKTVDRTQLAENLLRVMLRQMFQYRFFHADLHPGNLVALHDGVLGFVDFGLCLDLDDTVRRRQMEYLSAVYDGDINRMFGAVTEILSASDHADMEAFRREFLAETEAWLATRYAPPPPPLASASAAPYGSSSARYLIGVMRTARRHGFMAPPRILGMYRALLTAEAVSRRLSAAVHLAPIASRFFAQLKADDLLRRFEPNQLRPALADLLTLLHEAPGRLHQLLSTLTDGEFALPVEVSETANVKRAQDRRTLVLVTAIVTVGVAILLTATWLRQPVRRLWTNVLAGLLAALYVSILLQLRKL